MLKRYHQLFGNILFITDALGIICSWLFAYYLRFYTEIVPVTKGIPPFSRYVSLTVPVMLLWLSVFSYFSLYRPPKIIRRTTELATILKAHFVAICLFLALTYFFSEYRFSRVVVGYFGVISGIYFLITHLALRNVFRRLSKKDFYQKNLAIVGSGSTALAYIARIARMPELGICIKGIFVKDGEKNLSSFPTLGSFKDIEHKIDTLNLDHLVIALAREDTALQDEILSKVKRSLIDIHIVPDLYDYVVFGCTVEDFDGLPVLALNESPLIGINVFLKRAVDIFLAALALIILFPLFFIIALGVKLSSRGPIFYGQERMGLDGRKFKMWKFRSMIVNAESHTGAVWAKENDNRRTIFGTFLRKLSLDELPQFWNVICGEMSLVGPRPERPEFVSEFQKNLPTYMLRHKVKAGITGWAQVNGWRGNTSLEKRLECDLYYIRHWSLSLDLKILLLTFIKGLRHKNAY